MISTIFSKYSPAKKVFLSCRGLGNCYGLTLLELLVALSVTAMLLGIIASTFRLGIRSWEAGEKRVERNQRVRIIYDKLTEEIKSLVAYPVKLEGDETVIAFKGEAQKFSFVCTSPSVLSTQEEASYLHEISYYVGEDNQTGQYGLIVEESVVTNIEPFTSQSRSTFVIDPDVIEVNFEYLLPADEEAEEGAPPQESGWVDKVDLTNNEYHQGQGKEKKELDFTLPEAIKITLTFNKDQDLTSEEFPPLMVPVFTGRSWLTNYSKTSETGPPSGSGSQEKTPQTPQSSKSIGK